MLFLKVCQKAHLLLFEHAVNAAVPNIANSKYNRCFIVI